jgi:hypothetical protein
VRAEVYGTIGPNHTQKYSVWVMDDSSSTKADHKSLSARRTMPMDGIMLYQTPALKWANYTLYIENMDQGQLQVDKVIAWNRKDLDTIPLALRG